MMSKPIAPCPKCQSEYVYQDMSLLICPECNCEWDPTEVEQQIIVKDFHGNLLAVGDKLTLVKDLKVKGSSMVLKIGSKALVKRLLEGDHPLDCKVDGYGDMLIKADKVKKV